MEPLKKEIERLIEKIRIQQEHFENMEKHQAKIDAIYKENVQLHKELQEKAENALVKVEGLYKTMLAQKEELLAVYRPKQ